MLIDTVELTLNHVDLGRLSEFAVLALFGSAMAHRLVAGKTHCLSDIVDQNDDGLYPGYFMTHLRVPPKKLLMNYAVWQKIAIGIEVRTLGGIVLDSHSIMARSDEVINDNWTPDEFVSMRAGSMFFSTDSDGERHASVPKSGLIADDIEKLRKAPDYADRLAEVQRQGSVLPKFPGPLKCKEPILYPIVKGRDVAIGQNVMFATYARITDYAERELLMHHLWPQFPLELIDCRQILERETYYFAACGDNEVVEVHVAGKLDDPPQELECESNIVGAGLLTFVVEMYGRSSGKLILSSRGCELLAVPATRQSLLLEAKRLICQYSS